MRAGTKFPVSGPDLVTGPAELRAVNQHRQTLLNLTNVDFRLADAPGLGGVIPDVLDIALRPWPEHIAHYRPRAAVPRLRFRNASKSKGVAGPLFSPSTSIARSAASLVS